MQILPASFQASAGSVHINTAHSTCCFCAAQPEVTAFSGPPQQQQGSAGPSGSPGCSDPDVRAFSQDVNAPTPQAANEGVPDCGPAPPSPGACFGSCDYPLNCCSCCRRLPMAR